MGSLEIAAYEEFPTCTHSFVSTGAVPFEGLSCRAGHLARVRLHFAPFVVELEEACGRAFRGSLRGSADVQEQAAKQAEQEMYIAYHQRGPLEHTFFRSFGGSFSAVSTPIFAGRYESF